MYLFGIYVIIISLIIYFILYFKSSNHKNFKKRDITNIYIITTYTNLFASLCLFFIIIKHTHFNDNLIPKLYNIIVYFIISDTIYYWAHRIIHRTPVLKQFYHFTHHTAIDLIPMDIFFTDIKENILYLLIVGGFPLIFINVSLSEYMIINIIAYFHNYYTHSELSQDFIIPFFAQSEHHKYHHHIGGGNYSGFFTIWDKFMNTTINQPNVKSKKINKPKKNKSKEKGKIKEKRKIKSR